MTNEQALLGAIIAMSGALGILWKVVLSGYKRLEHSYTKLEERTEQCEKDRLALWKKMAEVFENLASKK
jgi:hypothetical protein